MIFYCFRCDADRDGDYIIAIPDPADPGEFMCEDHEVEDDE